MKGLTRQERKDIVEKAGFEWNILARPSEVESEPRHTNMTWWHFSAIAFSRFLARTAGVYSYSELKERATNARCDVFIFPTELNPTGLVIQWEPEHSKKLQDAYHDLPFFPNAPEVIVLGYNNLWKDIHDMHTGDLKPSNFYNMWYTKHQLIVKFNWYQYRKKLGDIKRRRRVM